MATGQRHFDGCQSLFVVRQKGFDDQQKPFDDRGNDHTRGWQRFPRQSTVIAFQQSRKLLLK
jgi:hypothetical protein